jgi:hypothetical protein
MSAPSNLIESPLAREQLAVRLRLAPPNQAAAARSAEDPRAGLELVTPEYQWVFLWHCP